MFVQSSSISSRMESFMAAISTWTLANCYMCSVCVGGEESTSLDLTYPHTKALSGYESEHSYYPLPQQCLSLASLATTKRLVQFCGENSGVRERLTGLRTITICLNKTSYNFFPLQLTVVQTTAAFGHGWWWWSPESHQPPSVEGRCMCDSSSIITPILNTYNTIIDI